MITIKGEHYYSDNVRPAFERQFSDMEELYQYLSEKLPYGKETLELPWCNEDGTIKAPGSYSALLRFKCKDGGMRPDTYETISLIEENSSILFSSGAFTGGKGHVGTRVAELFARLESYKKEAYNFGD